MHGLFCSHLDIVCNLCEHIYICRENLNLLSVISTMGKVEMPFYSGQYRLVSFLTGKARRLRQAKEEAQAEVEAYKRERERQYRENEAKVTH